MTSTTPPEIAAHVESLIPKFTLTRLLNSDQAGRRISLLGTIDSLPALLLCERAAFDTSPTHLAHFPTSLRNIQNLGANDIYAWFLANSNPDAFDQAQQAPPPDYKLNLIYPCTEKHINKYSAQRLRVVSETPEIYNAYIRPYMSAQRQKGTLNWVYNILEGRTEQDDVIYRAPASASARNEGFLLLPDLNWDRKTMGSMHLLGLVERRDIWSVRDLKQSMVGWVRRMREEMLQATVELYPEIEKDEIKCYVHYQPTYYHFHIHIVHVSLEAGSTQATGKALGLENIISQLETMGCVQAPDTNTAATTTTTTHDQQNHANQHPQQEEPGMQNATLTYHLGERSDLWTKIYQPLKEGREVDVSGF
ncbi:hypothetical protein IAQ61_003728 [Plenodomus lingam]|uniref:Scavenger mRNA decapping enzyme n=1 Tax=Leptosphaeria maculans (strain JN3 / isolate v23.1.3 / race Av1-4-5-6-7-8) TaxID=985895 RepID=E4ZRK1_LEPMJ|nr:hypothetical protein LEMA_P035220.1 [Plenodomus lingam JN3]KAH9874539.1 hypothetical protein IAQ61_003728 [Plenodomus lingam]CBX93848.1 hypothetical protein LEMA_P035220.1 [Plenodomus lingam JN3]